MTESAHPPIVWQENDQVRTLAVNVGARYVTLALELLLGLLMLPFNARHLGASEYRLVDAGGLDRRLLPHHRSRI